MTDTPAEKLTAEEEKRRAATREALERPMTSSERLRFSLVVAGDDGEWEPDPDDAQGTLDELDASRAETEAVRRERDAARSSLFSAMEHASVGWELSASLRSLAADLAAGLKAATAAINAATQLATAEMAGHDRTAERLDKQIWEAREQSRALLTRAAALGVKPRDGEKEKG